MKVMLHTTVPKTKEQLRAEAEALFADLLIPEPKVKAKAKTKPAHVTKFARSDSLDIIRRPTAKAESRLFYITEQRCSTCGGRHTYTSEQHLRFEVTGRKDHLAIETPAAIPLHEALDLPIRVIRKEESVAFCPTCLAACEAIDAITAATANNLQLELFV